MTLLDHLDALARRIAAAVGPSARVVTGSSAGTERSVEVTPAYEGPCPFVLVLQDHDAVSMELGVMSVVDFIGDVAAVTAALDEAVDAVLAGDVVETVWVRADRPVRARLSYGLGRDPVVAHTGRGGLPFGRRRAVRRYQPYGPATSPPTGPVVVVDTNGGAHEFGSHDDAADWIEWIDVEDGEYHGQDAAGRPLLFSFVGDVVFVRSDRGSPRTPPSDLQ